MASAFDEFISRKTKETVSFDGEQRIEAFRGKIFALNQQVLEYLSDFIKNGSISVSSEQFRIYEDLLGEYLVDGLKIAIGDTRVQLKPAGTILLGGIGRADLIGRGEPVMIVLTPIASDRPQVRVDFEGEAGPTKKSMDWNDFVWKIAVRRPTLRYIDLSKENFQLALMQVAG